MAGRIDCSPCAISGAEKLEALPRPGKQNSATLVRHGVKVQHEQSQPRNHRWFRRLTVCVDLFRLLPLRQGGEVLPGGLLVQLRERSGGDVREGICIELAEAQAVGQVQAAVGERIRSGGLRHGERGRGGTGGVKRRGHVVERAALRELALGILF